MPSKAIASLDAWLRYCEGKATRHYTLESRTHACRSPNAEGPVGCPSSVADRTNRLVAPRFSVFLGPECPPSFQCRLAVGQAVHRGLLRDEGSRRARCSAHLARCPRHKSGASQQLHRDALASIRGPSEKHGLVGQTPPARAAFQRTPLPVHPTSGQTMSPQAMSGIIEARGFA